MRNRVSSCFSVSVDQRLGAEQLGIGLAHLGTSAGTSRYISGSVGAEQVRMAHGAAHDAAQDIAAALVRRQHAVGDQEAGRAQMVGDDAVAGAGLALGLDAGQLFRGRDQGAEQVGVVIVVHALQDGGDALQPHAGVDRRARQVDALFFVTCSNCMKTRFQISMKRSPSSSGLPGGPPGMWSP